eukprot:g6298.t1
MNFNDSKKELMKGYVRSNMVHGKARRKLKDVLREYVRNAAPVNPNPPSLFSSHNILCDCSKMDEAHRYAEEMFHNLVASRELEEDHCNVLADLMYTVEDIHRIKTYMNIFNIPITEKILRIEIELLRLANRPYEHVVDEFEGEMTKRTKKLLAMKDLSERRHQYLKLWLLRGTRAREAAWNLFDELVRSNLTTTAMYKVMALYGCDSSREIQNKLLVHLNEDRDKDTVREVYGVLSYKYRLEADTMFHTDYDPIVRKLETKQDQERQEHQEPWQHEYRTNHLQTLLLRDLQSAWLFFCILDVRRALNVGMCTQMISGCYDEDEMRRRVLKSVHSKSDRLKVLEAMVEQNLILGDVRAAKHVAQSLPSDVFDRALRGDLIATIYGDLGTPLLSRRINAVRVWTSCGSERGLAAVSELFKRILSLKDHYDQKAWIFQAVIERMVESGQWDHATELLESAIRRGDVQNPVSYTADSTVTLSLAGLSRSTAIVAVRNEILRTNKSLMRIMFDSKQSRSNDLVLTQISELEERLTVMRATGELDSRSDWLIFQVLEAVRQCCRPDNSIMVTDIVSHMSDTDAMSRIVQRHGNLREFLATFPGLFSFEIRDVDILRVNFEADIESINWEKKTKTVFSILRSVRQCRARKRRHVLYDDVVREFKTTQSPRVVQYIKDRYKSLRVFLDEHHEIFKLRKKRDQEFLLLSGASTTASNRNVNEGDISSDEWYVLRTSVLGSLRSIGIEKIRQSSGGKVLEIGLKEIKNSREQFDVSE